MGMLGRGAGVDVDVDSDAGVDAAVAGVAGGDLAGGSRDSLTD